MLVAAPTVAAVAALAACLKVYNSCCIACIAAAIVVGSGCGILSIERLVASRPHRPLGDIAAATTINEQQQHKKQIQAQANIN